MNPIERASIATGHDGFLYKIEISIKKHEDRESYPEGVKAIFRLFRLDRNENNEPELLVLIDNHQPFGFHSHDKLPTYHNSRTILHITDWREAWNIFQVKCKEILR